MGTRTLRVSPDILVEMAKEYRGVRRNFSVQHPLPDDAKIISLSQARPYTHFPEMATLCVVLESSTWEGGGDLEQEPIFMAHFESVGVS